MYRASAELGYEH